jgi:hypothetical protein
LVGFIIPPTFGALSLEGNIFCGRRGFEASQSRCLGKVSLSGVIARYEQSLLAEKERNRRSLCSH